MIATLVDVVVPGRIGKEEVVPALIFPGQEIEPEEARKKRVSLALALRSGRPGKIGQEKRRGGAMPDKRPSVKNEKQYEALKDKGMSKERAAKIANSPSASSHGGKNRAPAVDSVAGRHDGAEEGRRS